MAESRSGLGLGAYSARRSSTPWLQIHGLGPNVVVPRPESAPRDDVDSDAQEFLKILEQADVIKKGGTWLKVDQQVKIAVRARVSSSY